MAQSYARIFFSVEIGSRLCFLLISATLPSGKRRHVSAHCLIHYFSSCFVCLKHSERIMQTNVRPGSNTSGLRFLTGTSVKWKDKLKIYGNRRQHVLKPEKIHSRGRTRRREQEICLFYCSEIPYARSLSVCIRTILNVYVSARFFIGLLLLPLRDTDISNVVGLLLYCIALYFNRRTGSCSYCRTRGTGSCSSRRRWRSAAWQARSWATSPSLWAAQVRLDSTCALFLRMSTATQTGLVVNIEDSQIIKVIRSTTATCFYFRVYMLCISSSSGNDSYMRIFLN